MLEVTRNTQRRAAVLTFFIVLSGAFASAQSLVSYNANINETSVSGISSGADMAVQFAVAHSSIIKGVGAIAGSPYYCAQGNSYTVTHNCMIGPPPDVSALKKATDGFAQNQRIDPTSNLAAQKVWLFTGYNDGIVKSPLVQALFEFYRNYTDAANIYFKEDLPAAHAMLTTWPSAGRCEYTGGHEHDFMNKCQERGDPAGYDAAGLILQHIYGKLNERNSGAPLGKIIEFSQKEFFPSGISSLSMDDKGYVYVPKACQDQEPCRVHIAFHGCEQGVEKVHSDFYEHAGYNEWADRNHLIVLYPQVDASYAWMGVLGISNPLDCWDWWGYTDGNYAQKDGQQMTAIENMLKRLAPKNANPNSAPTAVSGALQLAATDSSPSRIALAWTPVSSADGYNVYRAAVSDAECPKQLPDTVSKVTVRGNSYSDSGLAENTLYCYQVEAVPTNAPMRSNVTGRRTTTKAPPCDPYFRSIYFHWQEGRTHQGGWLWMTSYANGSNQEVGIPNPYSTSDWVLLTKINGKDDYYVVNQPCE